LKAGAAADVVQRIATHRDNVCKSARSSWPYYFVGSAQHRHCQPDLRRLL